MHFCGSLKINFVKNKIRSSEMPRLFHAALCLLAATHNISAGGSHFLLIFFFSQNSVQVHLVWLMPPMAAAKHSPSNFQSIRRSVRGKLLPADPAIFQCESFRCFHCCTDFIYRLIVLYLNWFATTKRPLYLKTFDFAASREVPAPCERRQPDQQTQQHVKHL